MRASTGTKGRGFVGRRRTTPAVILLAILAAEWAMAQPSDVERMLDEAKALYREARFGQALTKLQEVIGRLQPLAGAETARRPLADAHLHMALSHVALNDPATAKESLKNLVRVDPQRRLDPDVYAPKLIELMEEARAEVGREPPATVPSGPAAPQETKKGRSKAVPVILGLAGATGVGVAIAVKGGGGSPSATPTPAPAPAPAPTATPPPTVSGPEDIVFLSSDPPTGSTVSVGGGKVLRMVFSVIYGSSGDYQLEITNFRASDGSDLFACIPGTRQGTSIAAGQARTVEIFLDFMPCPRLPVTSAEFTGGLRDQQNRLLVVRLFRLGWTFTP